MSADGGGLLDKIVAALGEIRQASLDGDVRVWGKINRSGPHLPIERAFWVDHHIDELSIYNPDPDRPIVTACDHRNPKERYIELMVSRGEFERHRWPRKYETAPAP